MSTKTLFRLAAIAGILSGISNITTRLLPASVPTGVMNTIQISLGLFGVLGLYLWQRPLTNILFRFFKNTPRSKMSFLRRQESILQVC